MMRMFKTWLAKFKRLLLTFPCCERCVLCFTGICRFSIVLVYLFYCARKF
uniref:Uncharacterized protein n=1 Tax=Meloidogyne enterolobii TaxID=390850 RepID=A0A6V7XBL2_MELEN|nr:unnamed protein product [Meloidogyne enterolobii]